MSRAPEPAESVESADARSRGRLGPALVVLSLVALATASYLTWVKATGTTPVCAIVSGCETVENSRYSEFLGIPVAVFGMLGALASLVGSLLWWLRDDRRGLMLAYLVGLASLPVVAWLTYLELFVIHAICIWCVAYAVLVIATWVVAIIALRGPTTTEQA